VEAVRKRSKAGDRSAKARPNKALKLKRRTVPKAAAGRGSAMQQMADWLESLGLGQYAQSFADNGVDLSVLPDLTDQDLATFRRKIENIIARGLKRSFAENCKLGRI
jgi:hypothetical protein